MKTIKKWEKSGTAWDEYFNSGDRIDEATFLWIGEIVGSEYVSERYIQNGEADRTKRISEGKIYFHSTAIKTTDGRYYYLGSLPSFTQLDIEL